MKLKNKIAIITGAASGIGKACAELFSQEGATVVIADINQAVAKEVSKTIPNSIVIHTDVTNPASVESLIHETVKKFGRLDILMNNAGIDGDQIPIAQSTIENWKKVISINLDGVFYGLKYGITQMQKQKSGVILNTSSIAGQVAFPNIPPYSASKAGVIHLTKSAAIEYAKEGIRVNALCPSVVSTPLIQHFIKTAPNPEEMKTRFENLNPMPGIVSPEAVAQSALFLVCDDSKFITGIALTIDGGYTAQ